MLYTLVHVEDSFEEQVGCNGVFCELAFYGKPLQINVWGGQFMT